MPSVFFFLGGGGPGNFRNSKRLTMSTPHGMASGLLSDEMTRQIEEGVKSRVGRRDLDQEKNKRN